MRVILIFFSLILFAAADNSVSDFSKNNSSLPGDSLVSITDFGANPESDDNTDAFREAI